jgi:histidine triad (HIT) family protein
MAGVATCAFCDVVSGARPARVVLEQPETIAFLDHRPLFPGHCLLVPRRHVETLLDVPDELMPELLGGAQRLAGAIERALEAEGTFVAINNRVSQSVPHLHVHVVPRSKKDGLRGFFWPRNPYRDEAHAERVADLLRAELGSS